MNLHNTLGAEYNLTLTGLTGSLPVSALISHYAYPQHDTSELNHLLHYPIAGVPPAEIKKAVWSQPVQRTQINRIQYELNAAFEDTELHKVIEKVYPRYTINPHQLTLRDLAIVTSVQYAGFLMHLMRYKMADFEQQKDQLNHADTYQQVMRYAARHCPELVDHLPDQQPIFLTNIPGKIRLNTSDTKIKSIERVVGKADEYPIEKHAPGHSGIDAVKDRGRLTMTTQHYNRKTTLEDIQKDRNYLAVWSMMTEQAGGFTLTRLKDPFYNYITDNAVDHKPWPGIILNGKQTAEISTKASRRPLQLILEGLELQLAPMYKGNIHYKDAINIVRTLQRREAMENKRYGGREARIGSIEELYIKTLPDLQRDLVDQRTKFSADHNLIIDPAYDAIQEHIARRNTQSGTAKFQQNVIDVRGVNSINVMLHNSQGLEAMHNMVVPLPGQAKRTALIH